MDNAKGEQIERKWECEVHSSDDIAFFSVYI